MAGFLTLGAGVLTIGDLSLWMAVRGNRVGLVRALLRRGAPVDQKRVNGATPLSIAAKQTSLNIVAKAERRRPLTHKNFAGANISRGAQAAAAVFKGGGLKR